jgi:hypothetical protein
MNYAQAVEGYHRRRLNREQYPADVFEGYRATILKDVSGEPRRLAKKALRHANEISLEQRIKDVVSTLADPAISIVGAGKMDPAGFASRAAAIRNVYAHNLQGEQPGHHELVVLTYQLKAIVEALLLREIGFDSTEIDRMLREARRYDLIRAVAAVE